MAADRGSGRLFILALGPQAGVDVGGDTSCPPGLFRVTTAAPHGGTKVLAVRRLRLARGTSRAWRYRTRRLPCWAPGCSNGPTNWPTRWYNGIRAAVQVYRSDAVITAAELRRTCLENINFVFAPMGHAWARTSPIPETTGGGARRPGYR